MKFPALLVGAALAVGGLPTAIAVPAEAAAYPVKVVPKYALRGMKVRVFASCKAGEPSPVAGSHAFTGLVYLKPSYNSKYNTNYAGTATITSSALPQAYEVDLACGTEGSEVYGSKTTIFIVARTNAKPPIGSISVPPGKFPGTSGGHLYYFPAGVHTGFGGTATTFTR